MKLNPEAVKLAVLKHYIFKTKDLIEDAQYYHFHRHDLPLSTLVLHYEDEYRRIIGSEPALVYGPACYQEVS